MARNFVPLIYVDSSVYLDLIMKNDEPSPGSASPRGHDAFVLFKAIEAGLARLASSPLIEAEVMCNGQTDQAKERIRVLLKTWFQSPNTVWTDIDRTLSRAADELMKKHRNDALPGKKMGPADALHLAAAVRLKCDSLMTQDGGFPIGHTVDVVRVSYPEVVWQASLLEDVANE